MRFFTNLLIVIVSPFFFACQTSQLDEQEFKLVITAKDFEESGGQYQEISNFGLKTDLKLESDQDSLEIYSLIIENEDGEDWAGIIKIDLEVQNEGVGPRFFLPGFIYGTNRANQPMHDKSKTWPRLKTGATNLPFSEYFLTRSDRLSHPIACIFTGDKIIGIGASPYMIGDESNYRQWENLDSLQFYKFNGFGCRIGESKSSVSYTLGYENAPWLYKCCRDNEYQEIEEDQVISIPAGSSKEIRFTVFNYEAEDERKLTNAIIYSYDQYHQKPRSGPDQKTAIKDLSEAISTYTYSEEHKNYATSVRENNGKIIQDDFYSIAWTGGMTVAYPMLMASIRFDQDTYYDQSTAVIQNIVDNSMNEITGLPYDAHFKGDWGHNGWWQRYVWHQESKSGYSSYLIGQALFYILKSYQADLNYNRITHEDWLEFALKVQQRVDKTADRNGEYPYRFSEKNGDGAEYDSFGGAWCLASKAMLHKIDTAYADKVEIDKSLLHYWQEYIVKMECYGTPHDVWKATDQEGILAYIKAVKIMHEVYKEKKYLTFLKDAIDYEFTWKYGYNTPVQIPPLSNGWSSSGASITSIANPHAHAMGNIIADEIKYLADETKEDYYYSRLEDVLLWPLQSYNSYDGQFDFGKKGWMSERFCASEGLTIEKYSDGSPASTWFLYHSWGASSGIESHVGDNWKGD
jgi:hypothetical protein